MHITVEQLLADPYEACEMYNEDPETQTAADQLFCQASMRLAGFKIYGDVKPANHVIIVDIWNYYTPEEREIMEEANHPFYQAWLQCEEQIAEETE